VKPQRLVETFTCPESVVGTLFEGTPKTVILEASKGVKKGSKKGQKTTLFRPFLALFKALKRPIKSLKKGSFLTYFRPKIGLYWRLSKQYIIRRNLIDFFTKKKASK